MDETFMVERSQEWYERETTSILTKMEHQDLASVCQRFGLKTEGNTHLLLRRVLRFLNSEEQEESPDGGYYVIKSLYESLVRCFKTPESLHDSRAYFVNPFEETRPRRQPDFARFDVIGKPFTNPLKGMRQPTTIATPRNSLNFENPEYQEKIVDTPSNPFSPYMSTQVNPFIEQPTERFREFKIHGSIGAEGQKDKLSYSSLMYQIQDGQKKRFSEIDICAAVKEP